MSTVTKSLTIPAREVRPGDVLFGKTVHETWKAGIGSELWFVSFTNRDRLWLAREDNITVERPVPSDPIGTVRADDNGSEVPVFVFVKVDADEWEKSGSGDLLIHDSDVADFPILWKPGMPIPTEGVQA